MEKKTQFSIWYFAFALFAVVLTVAIECIVAGLEKKSRVTALARAIVTRYGMDDELGHVVYEKDRQNFLGQVTPSYGDKPYSEATAREIDLAVRDIVAGIYRRALDLLRSREPLLRELSAELLERETPGEADLERIRLAAAPVLPVAKAA